MDRPIGYWLKHLDALIDSIFDHVLAERGLHRRHWQVLNTVAAGDAAAAGEADAASDAGAAGDADATAATGAAAVEEALRPFWAAGGPTQLEIVADLAARGWLRVDAEAYRLTDGGRRAHADVMAAVAGIRARSLEGLTGEEYGATVATLRRMSANLEAALA